MTKMENKTKKCEKCNGTGKVNGRWVKEWHNTSWVPTEGKEVDVWKEDACPECKGKGYKELKWV